MKSLPLNVCRESIRKSLWPLALIGQTNAVQYTECRNLEKRKNMTRIRVLLYGEHAHADTTLLPSLVQPVEVTGQWCRHAHSIAHLRCDIAECPGDSAEITRLTRECWMGINRYQRDLWGRPAGCLSLKILRRLHSISSRAIKSAAREVYFCGGTLNRIDNRVLPKNTTLGKL